LIDSVFSDSNLPEIEDGRKAKINPLNKNFEKAEFKALWNKINQKAAYTVHFDTDQLIKKCISAMDKDLRVTKLQYTVQRGEQTDSVTHDELNAGDSFEMLENKTKTFSQSVHSAVKYDLIGKLAEDTHLTRSTIVGILKDVNKAVFAQYKTNPEDFILKTGTLINEQKATVIVEYLAYDSVEDRH